MTTTLAHTAADVPTGNPSAALHRFAVLFAAFTLLHIKGGAMVVSTGSGMAFTDWPLARGSLWPPGMDLEDLFEHLHRVAGSLVGVLGILLAVWVQRVDRRGWLRKLCWWLLGLIVVQGVLGGVGVLMGEEGGRTWAPAAIAHGVLGQATLCIQVIVAFALSRSYADRITAPAADVRAARKLGVVALVFVLLQLTMGAVFRHTNANGVLWTHVFMALVVSAAILIAAAHASGKFGDRSRGFRRMAVWVNVLLLLQLTLGFVTLGVRRFKDPSNIEYLGRSLIVSSHVIVGASLFLLATLLVAKAWRNLVPGGVDDVSAVTDTRRSIPLGQRLGAFVELGKLRLSSLAIFAVLAGLFLGYPSWAGPPIGLVIATAVGTLLVAAAGNALNQYFERDVDPLMERTRTRPLPSGRLTPSEVVAFGAIGAAVGLATLAAATNWLATALSAGIFVIYVFVYTPLKRVTPMNTIVGAVPGALPPVVGYAAATGGLDLQAGLLFLILFLWQVPHFLAISWRYRDDYRNGGMKMLAVTDRSGFALRRQMLVYTAALVLVSFLPFKTELAGGVYLAAAGLLGAAFMVPVTLAVLLRWESAMRQTFVMSIVYLPLLFAVMVLDRV